MINKDGTIRARKNNYKLNTKALSNLRVGEPARVSYFFEDGCIQTCPVNEQMFEDERGKTQNIHTILEILQDNCSDRRAEFFEIS